MGLLGTPQSLLAPGHQSLGPVKCPQHAPAQHGIGVFGVVRIYQFWYRPQHDGFRCGFTVHVEWHWITAQVEALSWGPEWDRDPQNHPNISTVEQKRWGSAKLSLNTRVYSPASLWTVLLHPNQAAQRDLTWFQETLKVSRPTIQHEASLPSPWHTCPLYREQGLSAFPQPFITFRSKTKTDISVCAQLYSLPLPYPITCFPEGPFAPSPEVSRWMSCSSSGVNPTCGWCYLLLWPSGLTHTMWGRKHRKTHRGERDQSQW